MCSYFPLHYFQIVTEIISNNNYVITEQLIKSDKYYNNNIYNNFIYKNKS